MLVFRVLDSYIQNYILGTYDISIHVYSYVPIVYSGEN